MSLSFPTGPAAHGIAPPPGHPARAGHCRCDRGPLLLGDVSRCHRCGRHPASVIARTFADRARQIASRRR